MYRPRAAIWAVGNDQVLAARAITHYALALCEINYDYLLKYPSPRLLESGIVYKDDSHIVCNGVGQCHTVEDDWQDYRTTLDKGYGDCDDLVCIRVAEIWLSGRAAIPIARCFKCAIRHCKRCNRPLGNGQTWHMQILHGDGRIEDISRWLGMPAHFMGDDAVVAPYDQVGIVRFGRRPPQRSRMLENHRPGIGSIVGRVLTGAFGSKGSRTIPSWVRNRPSLLSSVEPACAGGHVLCKATDKSPNPNGGEPIDGVASAPDYPWCVVVCAGDSARSFAERITGDRSRYVEILGANPDKETRTVDGAIDFAKLCVGERLLMPGSFSPWISQTGIPAGSAGPWPVSRKKAA